MNIVRTCIGLSVVASTTLIARIAGAEGGGPPGQSAPVGGFVGQPPGAPPPPGEPGQAPPAAAPGSQRVNNRQGVYTNVQLGLGLPVYGPLASTGAWGGWANVAAGWEIPNGLSGIIEGGIRYHYAGFGNVASGRDFMDLYVGVGGRYTPLREYVFHPFFQLAIDLHFVGIAPDGQRIFNPGLFTAGFGGVVGGEIDVHESVSIEFGLRTDILFTGHIWSAGAGRLPVGQPVPDLMLTPFVGVTVYL